MLRPHQPSPLAWAISSGVTRGAPATVLVTEKARWLAVAKCVGCARQTSHSRWVAAQPVGHEHEGQHHRQPVAVSHVVEFPPR